VRSRQTREEEKINKRKERKREEEKHQTGKDDRSDMEFEENLDEGKKQRET
jgi:hypothetical protein